MMSILPPANTPLNQHSLRALELWLNSLGAEKNNDNPCIWNWVMPQWSAEIYVRQDELMVIWGDKEGESDKKFSQFSFPYGLPRQDVEAALRHGP